VIHPTAVIDPKAELDPTVKVGPYAVIDAGVKLGAQCIVGPHVYLTGETTIGAHNVFHAGSVIGDAPQDLKYHGEKTGVRIGDHNVFREHVTVHRSSKVGEWTVIGSHTFLMANAHIGHNSRVADWVIIANGTLLGGYVSIDERAFISGNCLIHQFTRVGSVALMQGGSAISKDLPPFTIAYCENQICGLNVVGLRRAGYSSKDRLELRRVYAALFRSGLNMRQALAKAETTFSDGPGRVMIDFLKASTRGVLTEGRRIAGTDTESDI
jgi:UDP-N-acetylglucosamine acyltransferase